MNPITDNNVRTRLWSPSEERVQASAMWNFKAYLESQHSTKLSDYKSLHRWSVENLDLFWSSLWDYFNIIASEQPKSALAAEKMPGAQWFPDVKLNYAENLLKRAKAAPDDIALIGEHESLATQQLTWRQLEARTASLAGRLRAMGVQPGDRVVGFLPHVPETIISMLAVASIGATWSVVNTDFGRDGVLDRFTQLEPKVFITVDGYDFNGQFHEVAHRAQEIVAALPSVEQVIVVEQYEDVSKSKPPAGWIKMDDLTGDTTNLVYEQVSFDHPLWVLYSSGTTGKPKGIVHSHGGIVLEALKSNALHYDIRAGDSVYYAVSTTWAVWNMVVNTMMAGATVITYDGSPSNGERSQHLELVAKHRVDILGTGAAVLAMAQRGGPRGVENYDLTSLRTIMVTGSPLPDSTWYWIYHELKLDVMLCSESGGTEVAVAFVGANPFDDVVLGESMGACLGVAAETWNERGQRVLGEVGELVITRPMPSMPIYLWGDPDGERYWSTYFEHYPGIWRHGDWATEFPDGAFMIHGRSDATINRGGIRMGSSDITQVVDELDFVESSLVIGVELERGQYYMPLFVVPKVGETLTPDRITQVRDTIRKRISPRYIPDEIIAAPDTPRTRTGKLIEVPVKRLFQGASLSDINVASSSDPEIMVWYSEKASEFRRDLDG